VGLLSVFDRKKEVVIQEEKSIRDKLSKIKRSYVLIYGMVSDELKASELCMTVSDSARNMENHYSKTDESRDNLLSFIKSRAHVFERNLERKVKFILTDIKMGTDELSSIDNLRNIKPFNDINSNEAMLLEGIIERNKEQIRTLILRLKELGNLMELEGDITSRVENILSKSRKSENPDVHAIHRDIELLHNNLILQRRSIILCIELLNVLEKDERLILAEKLAA
jgi:hypothetical protein